MVTFVATGFKDVVTSDDGKAVTFKILLQFGREMVFTMPAAAVESFRLSQTSAPPADQVGRASAAAKKGRKVLHKPKKWVIGSEAKNNIVALIFDPLSEKETAFALSAKVARDLAAGLTKTADTLANNKPAKSH